MTPLAGPVLSAAEMRAAEMASGVPLDILMRRAGAALVDATLRFGHGQSTLVLCGPGNNGGDGYVAANLLRTCGVEVRVAANAAPQTDLAQAACTRWGRTIELLGDAEPAPIVLDCLFGTGLTRPLGGDYALPLRRLKDSARTLIAADLPSGVGADDGADLGSVGADLTIAFAAAKPAHLLQPGAQMCGRVLVADIGVEVDSSAEVLDQPRLAAPGPRDHKYTRGMVAVVGGAMRGAGALAATAAARAGAGYAVGVGLSGAMPHSIVQRPLSALNDLLRDLRLGALVIGPGLGRDDRAKELLAAALASDHALVIDGDALGLLDIRHRRAATILTPHAGELARMFGEGKGSKLERTKEAARTTGATIVFKGADTVIASPDGRTTVALAANPWLSSAGTGDVLAGITGAMLARGLGAHNAASAAVWLHGEAARRAGTGMIADDLCGHLPHALAAAIQ